MIEKKNTIKPYSTWNERGNERTGVEPALEGQAAVLDVEGEVVDVEGAGRHHLDGLVVAH